MSGRGLRRHGRRTFAVAALALTLVAGGAGTYLVLDPGGSSAQASGLTRYADTRAGFELAYPAGWTPSAIPEGVLFQQAPSQNAISVKKVTLVQAVDASNVDALRAVTDAVLSKPEAELEVLSTGPAGIGGLPGVSYVYRFGTGAAQGIHTHYFVFSGRDMYTLVFQALPAAGFEALAPTFDAVARTFRVL